VAADFPRTQALEAVATARLIYVNGRVDEYATWVRTLDFVAVTDAELDNDTYQGAENNFNKTTPSKAIAGFNGYINQFPRGIHALQANYYLAQLHYAEGAEVNLFL
jgi:TolA-binding protein